MQSIMRRAINPVETYSVPERCTFTFLVLTQDGLACVAEIDTGGAFRGLGQVGALDQRENLYHF